MISNACATMRTAISFLPLLRPFIIKLQSRLASSPWCERIWCAPVNQPLDDRHLCLLELLLGITASSVRQVNSVADLDVVRQRNILHFDTEPESYQHKEDAPVSRIQTHSWVSHFPNNLIS